MFTPMPSKNSKIVSARIPDYIEFEIPISRVLTSVYAGLKENKIGVNPKGLIFKSDCDNCSKGIPQIEENDPDGEWVREIAHELNINVKDFKRRIEQSIRR